MKTYFRKIVTLLLALLMLLSLAACGGPEPAAADQDPADGQKSDASEETVPTDGSASDEVPSGEKPAVDPKAPVIEGLTYESTLELEYAKCFQVYRYEGGYIVIRVDDGSNYILIPENGDVPAGLPADVTVIRKPMNSIYNAATASMSLFAAMNGLDSVTMCSLEENGWYTQAVTDAMHAGKMTFAGKYSTPDFEQLLEKKCCLAIESTMIWHSPDIMEKIQELGIPVFIDRASYEPNPLGRMEWIKLYGEMIDRQTEAAAYFDSQIGGVEELYSLENTGKTVAFFYVNSNNAVVVRKSNDYLAKMIDIAGGKYIFENLGTEDESATATVQMSMEEFYGAASDADYLIYNASISDPVANMNDLLVKSQTFANFKAVQNGNVWCTEKSLYQATDAIGAIIMNIHTMLTDDAAESLDFIYRLS
ncbi:MAG: ABC transporter substrate-binding protein [Oscillospiraceae bacterium]|nr:ABC transporter substrate-binding protein [Oscillospiraceae bacterium]